MTAGRRREPGRPKGLPDAKGMERVAKQIKAPGVPRRKMKPPAIIRMPGVVIDEARVRARPWDFKLRLGDGDITTPEARGLWFTCCKHALATVARQKREFTSCDLWELVGWPANMPPGIRTDEIGKAMVWGKREANICDSTGRYIAKPCMQETGHHDAQVWKSLKFGQQFNIGGYPA